jgi:hypothetical protein
MSIADVVLMWALKYVGTAEIPPHLNRGPLIDAWVTRVGSPLGSPWCAAYAWCMGAEALGTRWPVVKSGSCQAIYDWAKQKDCLVAAPAPGDLFLLYHAELSRYAHVGYVRSVRSDRLGTVEGNTNTDGSRDGWGVFARERLMSSRLAYVRWAKVVPNASL